MMSARATIDYLEGRITFEGSEEFVRVQVATYSHNARKSTIELKGGSEYEDVTPAALIAGKRPKGHHEIVAVLAFALAEKGQQEFTEDEMRRAYLQARVRPPKVIGQALRDAKNKFDLIEGGEKRGTYRLSHHGDRTVRYDLPRSGA
jgi:hypothetical protein